VAGVSVIFLILASLSALPSLFISAAIYHILKDRGAAGEHRLLYDARDLLYLCR
jgi:ABC-type tungstate transport system substrate-binding protein